MAITNEIRIMIKIRSGTRTPLDVSGSYYGDNRKGIRIGNKIYSKEQITDWLIKKTKHGLTEQIQLNS